MVEMVQMVHLIDLIADFDEPSLGRLRFEMVEMVHLRVGGGGPSLSAYIGDRRGEVRSIIFPNRDFFL